MISLEWIEKQNTYLTAHLGIFKLESGEDFFFEPTPGFYGFIAQGTTDALNEAMRMLGQHIESTSVPIIEPWKGPDEPLVTMDHDWSSNYEDPGFIRYHGPHRSIIEICITNKHSPLIMGAILAHELTHHYLFNKGICYPNFNENEQLTDLTTVYLGLGKLTLNGYTPIHWRIHRRGQEILYTYRVGYLSCREIAAIVDRLCSFRHISLEFAKKNLSPTSVNLLNEAHSFAVCEEKKKQAQLTRQKRRKVRQEKISVISKKIFPWLHRSKERDKSIKGKPETNMQNKMQITCGNCGQKLYVPIMNCDLRVKCTSCNKEFIIHSRKQ